MHLNINIKIIGKKNGLSRKNNYFNFTLNYLGMESLVEVMACLQEKGAAQFLSHKEVW